MAKKSRTTAENQSATNLSPKKLMHEMKHNGVVNAHCEKIGELFRRAGNGGWNGEALDMLVEINTITEQVRSGQLFMYARKPEAEDALYKAVESLNKVYGYNPQ
ncbi:MAG TPA: hypothetical protein VJH95_05420 [Candidatus Nanoarchaeia archaeon]|nr:hypothetical protein [Candidatus Nanoarchaeia archaeon]